MDVRSRRVREGNALLRDRALTRLCREAFLRHPRLARLPLRVRVHGQVAHVEGTVREEDQLSLIRSVSAGVRGIQAVWDTVSVGGRPPRILDIGCGAKKQSELARGVDILPAPGVDVVADLSDGLPFRDKSVDYIFAVHCLEHMADLVAAMAEIHRVLAPRGAVHIMVPAAGSTNATADPTHVRFFNLQTFKYFCSFRPHIPLFAPVLVSQTQDNVLADLSPVKDGRKPASHETLALFFD